MNRDDITRMAREAGFCTLLPSEHIDGTGGIYVGDDDITDSLKRFAALVAAAEREKVAAWMIQRGYATGHGDTTEDLLNELNWQIAERIAAEREACARVCEELDAMTWSDFGEYSSGYADDIRARGQK